MNDDEASPDDAGQRAPLEYTCAFCGGGVLEGDPRLMFLGVSRRGARAEQQFYAHRDCLAGAILPEVPLGEVFDQA